MNWWDVLEISYDSDIKAIKKAYAKLLKVYNPEDDAEGYQNLRQAYDKAIKYVKKNKSSQHNNNEREKEPLKLDYEGNTGENENKKTISEVNLYIDKINQGSKELENEHKKTTVKVNAYLNKINQVNKEIGNEKVKIPNKINFEYNDINYDKSAANNNLKENIHEFLNRLDTIYNDISLRINLRMWEELLNSDILWDLNSFKIIKDEVFKFLLDHKYLPSDVLILLSNNFDWTQNEKTLYGKYSPEKVDEFFSNLKSPSELEYDYLGTLDSKDADKYLELREKAYKMMQKKDYLEAKKYLFHAYHLFENDAELLRLIGKLYYDTNDFDNALKFSRLAFKLNNIDLDSALQLGHILTMRKCFVEAIPYLELYLSLNNEDLIGLTNIGYCYYYSNNFLKAREIFNKLLSIDNDNEKIEKYLRNVELKLKGKYARKIRFEPYKPKNKEERKWDPNYFRIYPIIAIVIIILHYIYGNSTASYHTDDTYEINHMVDLKDDKTFKLIKTNSDLREIKENMNVKLYIRNVKPINYFKLANTDEDKGILSKERIDAKNLNDKIESQLYLGIFNNIVIIFADNNFKKENLDENGGYILKGTVCHMDEYTRYNIQSEYNNTYNQQNLYWQGINEYIDCSNK
ncbi:J domain-containing protein [Clostridium sp.]|uniref:J domain-containing protein n=1 Tax=Clostridium sp. TaxID=1506 RepID=UPI002620543E|nr:J domain-containing protein [Clostridium sp.]